MSPNKGSRGILKASRKGDPEELSDPIASHSIRGWDVHKKHANSRQEVPKVATEAGRLGLRMQHPREAARPGDSQLKIPAP